MGLFSKKDKQNKKTSNQAVDNDVQSSDIEATEKKTSMKDLYKDNKSETAVTGRVLRSKNAHKVLKKPLITEKATNLSDKNKYIFEVSDSSNKIEVAKAIYEVYGVKPVSVNIVSVIGKKKRRGRVIGKRKDWKKAIVTLKQGDEIKIYEGV